MSGDPARLYEEDFVRWTEQQAAALRDAAGLATNLPLDWENLAEEIDGLGRSQRNELGSRLTVILEHLIKLENSPARDRRPGWMDTIDRERSDAARVLQQNPSLRGEVARMIAAETSKAARLVARSFIRHGQATPAALARVDGASYTEEQVLGDWFPGTTAPLPARRGEGVASRVRVLPEVLFEEGGDRFVRRVRLPLLVVDIDDLDVAASFAVV